MNPKYKNFISYAVLAVILIVGGYIIYSNLNKSDNHADNNFSNQSDNNFVNQPDDNQNSVNLGDSISKDDVQNISGLSSLDVSLKKLSFSDKYQKEAYENALIYEEKISANSDNYDDYNKAGFAWKSLGEYTKDERFFNRSAEIYMFAGKKFKAMAIYQPYQNAANVYITLKKYSQAEDALKKGINLAKEVGFLYVSLADLYEYQMNKTSDEIIAVYVSALSEKINQPDVIYSFYAAYLRRAGFKKEALEKFEKALIYSPTDFVKQSISELKLELGVN